MSWWNPATWFRMQADRLDGYVPDTRPIIKDPWADPIAREQMRSRVDMIRADSMALDGFQNTLTGIGDWTQDKTFGGNQSGADFFVRFLSGFDCEQRWRGSDLGARIVETIPDEMTREGWDMVVQPTKDGKDKADAALDAWVEARFLVRAYQRARRDALAAGQSPPPMPPELMLATAAGKGPKPIAVDDETAEMIEAVGEEDERLGVLDGVWRALCYERCYGGGAQLILADDGHPFDEPLDEQRIKTIRGINILYGGWDGEAVAWSYNRDVLGPSYGDPEMYMVRNLGVPIARLPAPGENPRAVDVLPPISTAWGAGYGPLITWVHASRLIPFGGTWASPRARVQMRGWADSLFMRVDEVLSDFDQTWGGIANLMTDFSQGVLKIDGLAQAIAANNKAGTRNLQARARGVQITRSIARLMLIDKSEDFTRDTASLAGLPELLQQFALRLAAAADMPVDLLMGQTEAGGLNKGDTTYRFFADRVAARQRRRLVPKLKRLYRLMFLAKDGPTGGKVPERWRPKMRPLYQMTSLEKADLRLKTSQADDLDIKNQVITPEEAAASHFATTEYSTDIVLDLEGREKMAEQDEADREARAQALLEAAKNSPDPNRPALPAASEKPPKNGADLAPGDRADAGRVFEMLSEDFPPVAVEWTKQLAWRGPEDVPLGDVDFSDRETWSASRDPAKVEMFVGKIRAGQRKPVILARKTGDPLYKVVDGHHRALAYEKLGLPILAYCAETDDGRLWSHALAMHDQGCGNRPEHGR